ncbi:dynamin family protein [Pectobacterium polaris]|uniref:Nucleotide exchange factor GrpE n=1 Tax=Pectobacterium polaris TaxID=2042057 RepID=A0AAW5GAC6_9GAMM|nr:dynamin family protein [Pectobacterium polaris]MCL6350404.1 nucleotide exchange factor GrpE [Pectobacterium polaris]MCL6367672.1 nucleotide exchange factor GrpE [Pectobacterium polaris]
MPLQQEKLLVQECFSQLKTYWQRYKFPDEPLKDLESNISTFSVRLPLIGAFSAGKSSLINTFLQENLLSVAINPETSLPTELRFSPNESIHLLGKQSSPQRLSRDELKNQAFGEHNPENIVEICLPSQELAQLEGMTLVDMPGWESGIKQHSLAIDNYLDRSAAYCVVVSVDEGVLKESLRKIIEELSVHEKPVMLVITKCDKKRPEDVDAVVQHVQQQVETITQKSLLAVCRTQRKNATEWAMALQRLLPLQQQFFHQAIGISIQKRIEDVLSRVNQLAQSQNQTLESIENKREVLTAQYQRLQDDLQQVTATLQEQREVTTKAIINDFTSKLNAQLDTLSRALLNGEETASTIGHALRMAYSQGIERHLKPAIRQELGQLRLQDNQLPEGMNFSHTFQSDSTTQDIITNTLAYILPMAITLITRIPMAKLLTPIIVSTLESLFNRGSKELIQRQQQEEARQHVINTVIPACCTQATPEISRALSSTIEDIMKEISRASQEKLATVQTTLDQVTHELTAEKNAESQRQQTYQQDRTVLQQILTQLQEFNHG